VLYANHLEGDLMKLDREKLSSMFLRIILFGVIGFLVVISVAGTIISLHYNTVRYGYETAINWRIFYFVDTAYFYLIGIPLIVAAVGFVGFILCILGKEY